MSPIATKPGGTFCDVGVRNVNQDGDETLEVWIRELQPGAGEVSQPAPGVFTGATDFSEFPVGLGVPAGITPIYPSTGPATSQQIANDAAEGNYFAFTPGAFETIAYKFDAFTGIGAGDDIELLARVWVPAHVTNRRLVGPAFQIAGTDQTDLDCAVGGIATRDATDYESSAVRTINGTSGAILQSDWQEAEATGVWVWQRFRVIQNNGDTDWKVKTWTGAIGDEPVNWDGEADATFKSPVGNDSIGWVVQALVRRTEQRIAFLSFSTDPDNFAPGEVIPPSEGPWALARSVPVAAGEDQVVRIEDLTPGTLHDVALRYRRGTKYNAGAEDTDDPTTWPSVSQGQFTTTVDPPTFVSAVWSRTGAAAEQILLTVTPENPDDAIAVYREKEGDGAPTRIGEIAGPHGATADFTDTTIEGEAVYFYSFATVGSAGDGGQSDQERIWSGPPAIPVFRFYTAEGGGYGVAFEDPADDTQGLELHDTYDNVGGTSPFFSLRSEIDPIGILTEIFSGELSNIPSPDITFQGKIRFTQTASGTEDFGEFSPAFNVTVPESGGVA